MKKIIFLDIDGVLNSFIFFKERYKEKQNDIYRYLFNSIDDEAVKKLQKIIEETNAEIVVSSMWRLYNYDNLKKILKEKGLKANIIDKTPSCKTFRGVEIYEWIRNNIDYLEIDCASNFKNYVILDDDDDMLLRQKNNFVQTTHEFGLTEEEVKKVVEILKDIHNEY